MPLFCWLGRKRKKKRESDTPRFERYTMQLMRLPKQWTPQKMPCRRLIWQRYGPRNRINATLWLNWVRLELNWVRLRKRCVWQRIRRRNSAAAASAVREKLSDARTATSHTPTTVKPHAALPKQKKYKYLYFT
jgi:hypothetical protein